MHEQYILQTTKSSPTIVQREIQDPRGKERQRGVVDTQAMAVWFIQWLQIVSCNWFLQLPLKSSGRLLH